MTRATLDQLRAHATALPAQQPVSVRRVASGSAFITRQTQHFASVRHDRPFVGLVLDGRKAITFRGARSVLGSGDVLVVPRGVEYEASVAPDRRSGCFRVFIIELEGNAAAAFARSHPAQCRSAQLGAFETDRPHVLPAQDVTLLSFLHFASTLLSPGVQAPVLRHRLEDLVLSLSLQHVAGAVSSPRIDLVLAARLLVRDDPARAWTSRELARHFAMSPATLRRRLAGDGVSLRALRAEERMTVAAGLLARRDSTVAEVAARCGYGSPSKFARQFRRQFGRAPRDA